VPKEVVHIYDHLFINTYYKSNNIKNVVNDMTVHDSEMCVRMKRRSLVNTGDISNHAKA